MNKTYFGYETKLSSKELSEAIATQPGPGPIFGYGHHTLAGSVLTLYPSVPINDTQWNNFNNHFGKLINDRLLKRLNIKAFNGGNANFACITKDGYIGIINDNTITINIENLQSTNNEIIVVAEHSYAEINTELPVTYRAFWSQSNSRFFELYKKSIDNKYPTPLSDRTVESLDIDISPVESRQLSYTNLYNTAMAATGASDTSNFTLIGIYGTGNDLMSDVGELQKFAIIPYDGKFPMEIGYSWASQNYIKDLFRNLYKVFDGIGQLSFKDYLKKLLSESDEKTETVSVSLPVGTIVMWYGSTSTIPYGWEICDGTASVHNPNIIKPNLMGRMPMGLSTTDSNYGNPLATGGSDQIVLEVANMPQHSHVYTGDQGTNGLFPAVESGFPQQAADRDPNVRQGTAGQAGNQGVAAAYYTSKTGGSKPVDIRPSYTVVAFIIKTLE